MTSNPYQSPAPVGDSPENVVLSPFAGGWKLVLVAVILSGGLWLFPVVNFIPLLFLGWTTSRAWPHVARRIARAMALVAGAMLVVLVVTGVPALRPSTGQVHQWFGLTIVSLLYCCVAFALGVLLHQKLTRRPLLAIGQSCMLLFCLAVSTSASLTGYLDRDPVPYPELAEENHNRFVVLHMFVMPMLIATMLFIWHLTFGPAWRVSTGDLPQRGGSA